MHNYSVTKLGFALVMHLKAKKQKHTKKQKDIFLYCKSWF